MTPTAPESPIVTYSLAATLGALVFLAPASTRAADLRVPLDHARVASAIAAAEDGDRIVLAPGEHLVGERLVSIGKSLEIASEDLALPARLVDASLEFTGGEDSELRLTGLVFVHRSSLANLAPPNVIQVEHAARFSLVSCTLENTTLRASTAAIQVIGGTQCSVSDCSFRNLQGMRSVLSVDLSEVPVDGSVELLRSRFESCSSGTGGILRVNGGGTCRLSDVLFLGNRRAQGDLFCVVAGDEIRLQVDRTHFERNGGPAIFSIGAAEMRLDRVSIVAGGSFLWSAAPNLPQTALQVSNSILWCDPPEGPQGSTLPIDLRHTFHREFSVRSQVDSSTENPRFCGWGRRTVWIDGSADGNGDGSQQAPYRTLQETIDAHSFALRADSPCHTASDSGGPIGAPLDVCPVVSPFERTTLVLARGDYVWPRDPASYGGLAISGAGIDETFLDGTLGPLGNDSRVEHLTVRGRATSPNAVTIGVLLQGRRAVMVDCRVEGPFTCSIESAAERLELRRVYIGGRPEIGVEARACEELLLENCEFSACRRRAVISDAAEIDIDRCSIFGQPFVMTFPSENPGRGIELLGPVRRAQVRDSAIAQTFSRDIGSALSVSLGPEGLLELVECRFLHNNALTGGGVDIRPSSQTPDATGTLRVEGSTFTGNTSAAGAAALSADVRDAVIEHCTFYSNHSLAGASVVLRASRSALIESSILWQTDARTPWEGSNENLEFRYCCVSGEELPRGLRNIGAHPRWYGAPRAEAWIDSQADPGGDGSRREPFRSLEEASGDTRTLTSDSPCVGAAADGLHIGAPATVRLAPRPECALFHIAAGDYDARRLTVFQDVELRGLSRDATRLLGPLSTSTQTTRLESLSLRAVPTAPTLYLRPAHRAELSDVAIHGSLFPCVHVSRGGQLVAQSSAFLPTVGRCLALDPAALATLRHCDLRPTGDHSYSFAWSTMADSLLELSGCTAILRPQLSHLPPQTRVQSGRVELENCFLLDERHRTPSVGPGRRLALAGGHLSVESTTWIIASDLEEPLFEMRAGGTAEFRNSILWGLRGAMFFDSDALADGALRFALTALQVTQGGETPAGVLPSDPRFVDSFPLDGEALSADDFRLRWDSPLIDAALTATSPEFDLLGTRRPCHAAPDIGAIEFCGARRPPRPLLRGDVDESGEIVLSDAVRILDGLFSGLTRIDCLVAADVNEDANVDLTDAIRLLDWLFLAGPPPAGSYPDCELTDRAEVIGCFDARACN